MRGVAPSSSRSDGPCLWDLKRAWNLRIESCQNRVMSNGQLGKMPIRSLRRGLNPSRKRGDIVVVGEKSEREVRIRFHLEEKLSGVIERQSVSRRLRDNAHEAEFCDGTSEKSRCACGVNPTVYTLVECMLAQAKGDKGVHVEQVFHGKSASISLTCSLVRIGASGPASR